MADVATIKFGVVSLSAHEEGENPVLGLHENQAKSKYQQNFPINPNFVNFPLLWKSEKKMAQKVGLLVCLMVGFLFSCGDCVSRSLGNRSLEEYKPTCKDWGAIRPQFNQPGLDVRELTDKEKNALFRCYDLDDDGKISLNEFLNFAFFLSGVGRPENSSVRNNIELYNQMDKNHDKKLSYEEFRPYQIWL